MAEKLLRRGDVEQRVGVKHSTIYTWMARGEFPKPVRLGAKMVAWPESTVDAWIKARQPKK